MIVKTEFKIEKTIVTTSGRYDYLVMQYDSKTKIEDNLLVIITEGTFKYNDEWFSFEIQHHCIIDILNKQEIQDTKDIVKIKELEILNLYGYVPRADSN